MLGVGDGFGQRRYEQLWNFVVVEILPDGEIGGVAKRAKDEGDAFLLDETPRLLDSLRRAVAVVDANQVDFAAVDAALFVNHPEVGRFRPADDAIGRSRPAVGHGLANLDLRAGDPGSVGGSDGA